MVYNNLNILYFYELIILCMQNKYIFKLKLLKYMYLNIDYNIFFIIHLLCTVILPIFMSADPRAMFKG